MKDAPADSVTVRLAQPADAVGLQAACFLMNTVEEVSARLTDNLAALAEGTRLPLVAVADGAVVGHSLLIRDPHVLRRHRATWHDVVVAGAYQRRGIARRLLEETCRRAAAMGVELLETSARGGEPAEEVYRRLGFREWGRLPNGLRQSWGRVRVFDEVYFFLPVTVAARSD